MRTLLPLLLAFAFAAPAQADEPAEWPYPQDIPSASPADPGLAGEVPPNIVRFLKIRGIGAARLSPDGTTLAFRKSTTGEPQLWTVDAEGGWPNQLTFAGAVSSHMWSPDGSRLLYGADREGDERLGLTLINAAGTEEKIARPYSDAFVVPGAMSSDGKRLAYSSTQRNGVDFDIYVLDLEDGSERKVKNGKFGFFVSAWRPGTDDVIVSETRGEDGNNLHLLNVKTGRMRTLFDPMISSAYQSIEFLPDGSAFYMVTDQDREYRALARFEMRRRRLSIVEAPANHDVDSVELAGNGRFLLWITNEGGYSKLHARDLETGNDVTVPANLPEGVYGLDAASAAPVVAISVNGPRTPGDVYVWNLEKGTLAHAAKSDAAGIDLSAMVVPESVFFKARDGIDLNGLLYMPQTDSDALPPVLVRVHGGPTAQARPTFRSVEQYLIAQGIAVFDLNFRGSTGFGKTFARLDNQFDRRDAVRDVADAVAWLADSGTVDTTRAAVMGGSYGGYLTNAVVGEYPDTFVAGVSFVGVSDWVRALETASPALKASDQIEYGDIGDPKVREFHAALSPINDVDKITAAMMVLHGANDPRDPVAESDAFVTAIREKGGTVEYLRFPDEGHGIRKLTNRITAYRRVAAFLKEQLKVE